jgi:hypothetical protein
MDASIVKIDQHTSKFVATDARKTSSGSPAMLQSLRNTDKDLITHSRDHADR